MMLFSPLKKLLCRSTLALTVSVLLNACGSTVSLHEPAPVVNMGVASQSSPPAALRTRSAIESTAGLTALMEPNIGSQTWSLVIEKRADSPGQLPELQGVNTALMPLRWSSHPSESAIGVEVQTLQFDGPQRLIVGFVTNSDQSKFKQYSFRATLELENFQWRLTEVGFDQRTVDVPQNHRVVLVDYVGSQLRECQQALKALSCEGVDDQVRILDALAPVPLALLPSLVDLKARWMSP